METSVCCAVLRWKALDSTIVPQIQILEVQLSLDQSVRLSTMLQADNMAITLSLGNCGATRQTLVSF